MSNVPWPYPMVPPNTAPPPPIAGIPVPRIAQFYLNQNLYTQDGFLDAPKTHALFEIVKWKALNDDLYHAGLKHIAKSAGEGNVNDAFNSMIYWLTYQPLALTSVRYHNAQLAKVAAVDRLNMPRHLFLNRSYIEAYEAAGKP